MKLLIELLEALKPSQYRQFVKGWDKSKYADLFKKYETDKKGFRIYLPMKGGRRSILVPHPIWKAIEEKGYEVEDYGVGIAVSKDGKRRIKIGKLLSDNPDLLKQFQEDPKRAGAKKSEYFVVISRHPYDIAGMSTDRGWKSCMNLVDGVNKHYVAADVKEGTLVAYLVTSDDKNINKPVCRVLIKPFIEVVKDKPKRTVLGIESQVYGTNVEGFTKVVEDWVDEVNGKDLEGIFQLNPELYPDGETLQSREKYFGKAKEIMAQIEKDPKAVLKYENASPGMIARAATVNHSILYSLKDRPTKFLVDLVHSLKDMSYDEDFVLGDPDDEDGGPTWEEVVLSIPHAGNAVLQKEMVVQFGGGLLSRIKQPTNETITAAINRGPLSAVLSPLKYWGGYANFTKDNLEHFYKAFLEQFKKLHKSSEIRWSNAIVELHYASGFHVKFPDHIQLEMVNTCPQVIVDLFKPTDEALKLAVKLDPKWLEILADADNVNDPMFDKYPIRHYNLKKYSAAASELLERAKKLKTSDDEDK